MRKLGVFITLSILLAGLYLSLLYGRFYNNIGDKHLLSPYIQNRLVLLNPDEVGTVRYVALGDSLTAGVGSDDVESTFVYQVAKKLSSQFGKVEVVNLGVSGATSKDLIEGQLPQVAKEEPQYITLLIGVNDVHNKVSAEDFRRNLTRIVDHLLTKTAAQIVLLNLPYLGAPDVLPVPLSSALNARTKQFNTIISEFGSTERVQLIDLYSGLRQPFVKNPAYYASDRFHPSGEGYLLFGKIINAD